MLQNFYIYLRTQSFIRTSILSLDYYLNMRGAFHSPAWRKFFASLFLLWALVDLTVPGVCKSDNDGVTDPQQMSMVVSTDQSRPVVASAIAPTSNPEKQKSPDQNDEDCFCCCVHVAPSAHFQLPKPVKATLDLTVYSFHQVVALAPSLYHPPRT